MLLLAAVFIFLPAALYPADLSIGAASWYADWVSYQKGPDPEVTPTFLYGPVISIGLPPDWSITAVFLYGRFTMDVGNDDSKLSRYDSDLALNYSITRYMKIFGGVKFMGYTWDEGDHYGVGPAAGVGFTLPVSDSLFLLWNFSGMYAFAKEKGNQTGEDYRTNAREPGVNTTLSLAYYIESASTTISLGGRYQWFKILYDKDDSGTSELQFYGATLSAVYSFGK